MVWYIDVNVTLPLSLYTLLLITGLAETTVPSLSSTLHSILYPHLVAYGILVSRRSDEDDSLILRATIILTQIPAAARGRVGEWTGNGTCVGGGDG